MAENPTQTDGTLAHHLAQLASTADSLEARLAEPSSDSAIHPEALGEAAKLSTSLGAIVHALTHHEHLAMGVDDVWKLLTIEHRSHDNGEFT